MQEANHGPCARQSPDTALSHRGTGQKHKRCRAEDPGWGRCTKPSLPFHVGILIPELCENVCEEEKMCPFSGARACVCVCLCLCVCGGAFLVSGRVGAISPHPPLVKQICTQKHRALTESCLQLFCPYRQRIKFSGFFRSRFCRFYACLIVLPSAAVTLPEGHRFDN